MGRVLAETITADQAGLRVQIWREAEGTFAFTFAYATDGAVVEWRELPRRARTGIPSWGTVLVLALDTLNTGVRELSTPPDPDKE